MDITGWGTVPATPREFAHWWKALVEVATVKDGVCPDCGGEPVFDEGVVSLVCAGCGQLLREQS